MLLSEIVMEAKFRKPRVMYHGTTSAFLRTILKQGIVPNPKNKHWDSDDNLSQHFFSRKSLFGSYWTSNLMTAKSSATNTNKKFPGNPIIIIAQIAEQSAYADEDDVTNPILWAIEDTNAEINPQIRRNFSLALADDVFGDDPTKRARVQNIFAKYLHQRLKGDPKHEPNRKLFNELLDILIIRSILYEKKHGIQLDRWIRNVPNNIPDYENLNSSIREIEEKLLMYRDQITRSYRSTAIYKQGDFNHTLRMTTPVDFSGGNKILSIIEFPSELRTPLILVYGKHVPEIFIKEYRDRLGHFPGLMDKNGNIIIEPETPPWCKPPYA